jgi:hypothetical protein
VSGLYAVPNLFGEVPAVQVSGLRTANKVDADLQKTLDEALKAANVTVAGVDLEEGQLRYRFAIPDTQLRARDVGPVEGRARLCRGAEPRPEHPALAAGDRREADVPRLDLRGGVHFLLQVDMKGAANKAVERYMNDARGLMREKKIYYSGLAREGAERERIVIRFRETDQRAAALKVLVDAMPDLTIREQDGAEAALVATVKPEVVKRDRSRRSAEHPDAAQPRERARRGRADRAAAGPGPHRRASSRASRTRAREGNPRPHGDPRNPPRFRRARAGPELRRLSPRSRTSRRPSARTSSWTSRRTSRCS